jgi:hypothetical protein
MLVQALLTSGFHAWNCAKEMLNLDSIAPHESPELFARVR